MTKIAELNAFIADKIEASGKTQAEIAKEAGFHNPNVLAMVKLGATPLPIEHVAGLADALGVERIVLLTRVLAAYQPDLLAIIQATLPEMPTTADEIALLRGYKILKKKGVVDENGVEIRALGKKGREGGWARIFSG